MSKKAKAQKLPFEKQLVESLREPGSHLLVLNDLSDSVDDECKKKAILDVIQEKMDEFAKELQEESDKQGILVSLKTILVIKRENK